jgi:hypothetical protein
MAAKNGSTGFLAHNYLVGSSFASFVPGQVVYIIYGDGRTKDYIIKSVYHVQALQPNSPPATS